MCAGAARASGCRSAISTSASLSRTTPAIPRPAQIILYPGGISETEILLAYGGVHFASKWGIAGNHFITLTSDLENLPVLGKTVLWKGAQKIRFEIA